MPEPIVRAPGPVVVREDSGEWGNSQDVLEVSDDRNGVIVAMGRY